MQTDPMNPRDVIAEANRRLFEQEPPEAAEKMDDEEAKTFCAGLLADASIAALTASGPSIVPAVSDEGVATIAATIERHPPEIEELVLARDEWRGTALSSQKEMVKAITRAEAAEASLAAVTAERDRMVETLERIADTDWYWEGGGSDIRHRGRHGKIAAMALGISLELLPGWPDPKVSETRAALTSTEDRT